MELSHLRRKNKDAPKVGHPAVTLASSLGWFRRWCVAAPEQPAQNHIEHRDKEQVQDCGEQHAADNGGADGAATQSACTGGEDKRKNAEDESEGSHQNGPQTQLACFGGCIGDGASFAAQLLGKLDDQN